MKICIALLLAGAVCADAALVRFDLSPAGTDVAVGLSVSNEVPAVTNSTGSGGAISGGIVFDTDTTNLQFAIGYGSAAGFTDLTGPATAMHIHGPAAPGVPAGVLVSLVPFSFPAADPTKGGVIVGTVAIPPDSVSNLLAGFTYVNIHTATNPPGEIRGQLIAAPVNAPPTVTCAPDATADCGVNAMLTITVSDPEGDPLTVTWSANGTAFQTNTLPAGTPGTLTPVSAVASLPVGTNMITVVVMDAGGNTASCGSLVTVVDTTPPAIMSASARPNVLWPPNHQMQSITVRVDARDSCSRATWRIVRVTSDEAVNGHGDGNTSPDWQIIGDHGLKLRAERSGRGDGRVYTIVVEASDSSGNVSETRRLTVKVPKSQGNGRP